MTVRSERPTLYWVPVCQTGHVWKNTYVKNGTNFSDTAVGFFMSLLCSICHLFPTAKVFKIVCQCFLQVIALTIAPVWISILRICVSTSVSQNFSPLKLVASKTTRRKGGTWANMRESEANPTQWVFLCLSCALSIIIFQLPRFSKLFVSVFYKW